MMANIERIRGSNGNGEAVRAVVTAARAPGATTLQVGSVTNFPNEFIGTWGRLNQATGLIVAGSARVFYGKLNGSNIDLEGMAPGYTDDGNQQGDVVLLKPNTTWADELAEVLRTSHNDDGTLKDSVVTTDKINNSAITTAKINNLAVTTGKLANKSVTPAKVDFTTTTSNGWKVMDFGSFTRYTRTERISGGSMDSLIPTGNKNVPLPAGRTFSNTRIVSMTGWDISPWYPEAINTTGSSFTLRGRNLATTNIKMNSIDIHIVLESV